MAAATPERAPTRRTPPAMLSSWYVALGHRLPTQMPPELWTHRSRVLFARWLALTGRLSDFGPYDGRRPGVVRLVIAGRPPEPTGHRESAGVDGRGVRAERNLARESARSTGD